ncbi:hypothetical protein ACEUAI_13555 [Aeromonas veronii]
MDEEFKNGVGTGERFGYVSLCFAMFFLIAVCIIVYVFLFSKSGEFDRSIVTIFVGMSAIGGPVVFYQERMERRKRYFDYLDNFEYIMLIEAMSSDLDKQSKAAISQYLSIKELPGKKAI